ncbi:Centrosome-associated zinc finger protein CP190 [Eumeta japonica]|uniref:Centrosome-associated zinc finger protein CP190 n=1 Tax=Eumeta variegata TaxID=151549 RepID=A0A4C1Z7N9_EUMVA|nr:Centrosome-associated zinc finger protein CP190 [Eumeta japonica]
MSDTKQVKVDNWGIYFLQRLKHFFNRTDYCDLTLQFQDNAQLKVHRLVLNACTEYFEYLERMCEMYEDCLIMPDDLQADVVVPIVNFMYTGQLEYRPELLEKLYQTAQIMNMTVLTKLLDAQRNPIQDSPKQLNSPSYSQSYRSKRSYTKAFEGSSNQGNQKKVYIPTKKTTYTKPDPPVKSSPGPSFVSKPTASNTQIIKRRMTPKIGPTRYEIPEELESDFDDSFSNISYESRPLMIHPQLKPSSNKTDYRVFDENLGSKKIADFKRMILDPSSCTSTIDVVECKKINNKNETLFEDDGYVNDYNDVFDNQSIEEPVKDTNQLFDEILDNDGPKVTFETKELKEGSNIDHAKIISEVLKKYPHLVKSNKSIKLKIVNASSKQNSESKTITRPRTVSTPYNATREIRVKNENTDQGFTYETDVIDSKEAARLIAMGAENISGPWICLICGTPGKALHFTSYYKYRRHLVEVHKEKPIVTICEHCGLKSNKRNYMLHHMYTKHGIPPPPSYKFPKCNQCPYVALTEAFLIKHKLSHSDTKNMNCNVCFASFKTPSLLLQHMQTTGHKISAERKPNLQCIYCLKVFLRESNLYAHLKTYHKQEARNDNIIDNSDEEEGHKIIVPQKVLPIKYEPEFIEEDSNDTQYQIQQKSDDNIQILMKSPKTKQKILNQDLDVINKNMPKQKMKTILPNSRIEFIQEEEVDAESQPISTLNDNVVMINDNEFIIKDHADESSANQSGVYIDPQVSTQEQDPTRLVPSTSEEFAVTSNQQQQQIIQQPKMILKKAGNISQPIQIVVSNEEEYKALMASNSSIIFDGTSTTIDLNNHQSNDMMIIQQDFPLNVSEAVQTENSNIVVVYSHPVDDQNKQYLMNAHYGQPQLITSQALGAQFVQSSAVITQNFETITTSAPIVSGPVLVQQPIESWENNLQQNIVDPTVQIATNSLQQITTQQTQMLSDISLDSTQTNVVDTMTELPDIQLVSQEQSAVISSEDTCGQPDVHQTEVIENTVIVDTNEHQHIQESNNVTITEIESNGILQEESVHENIEHPEVLLTSDSEKISEIEHISNVEQPLNNPEQPDPGILESANNIPATLVQIDQQEISMSEANENTIEISDTINPESSNAGVQNILFEGEEQELSHIQEVSEITNESESTKNEQIQNLTSEWSEEEEDKTVSGNLTDENMDVSNLVMTNTSNENDKVEVEESIENIQQEMQKQMMEASTISQNRILIEGNPCSINTGDKENLLQPLQTGTTENTITTIANGKHEGLQQKISSLLNDWDENDSQDESEEQHNVGDEEVHISGAVNQSELEEHVKLVAETEEPAKNENIKSLVSDWDDDDDDEKVN